MVTRLRNGLSNVVTKSRIQRFYDLGSPLYLEVYGENIHDGYYSSGKESRQEAQKNLTRFIAEKARIEKGAQILDVGCGVGGSSVWLAENFGATTVGITISPVQVEIARRLARERKVHSSFLLMDAENMKFDRTFDVIWVVAASTHFQSQEGFIRTASAFLKKGGKFVVFDWMANEDDVDLRNERYLRPVKEGMLLLSLCSVNSYLEWFIRYGYQIKYAEDITEHTIKTWDAALSVIKEPGVLKLANRLSTDDVREAMHFLKSIRAMKRAMKNHKLISALIVAEKV
jgi:tocopherol O-methyltransferase